MQRQERFHLEYMRNVECLIETISPHIQHKYKDLPEETRHATLAVAEFVKVIVASLEFLLINLLIHVFSLFFSFFHVDNNRNACR